MLHKFPLLRRGLFLSSTSFTSLAVPITTLFRPVLWQVLLVILSLVFLLVLTLIFIALLIVLLLFILASITLLALGLICIDLLNPVIIIRLIMLLWWSATSTATPLAIASLAAISHFIRFFLFLWVAVV